ncbi:MAG TPA: cytochrome c oxidase subunit I [Gaiellaceae bacterium]|nr:cytochrome c oxidase subunit I [Gaiellaceae bacterium]
MAVSAAEAAYPVTWKNGRVASWLVTVDHKRIGILYILTSLFFFVLGGILAVLMRAQLAAPNETFLTKNSYNEALTMHGTTMIFLVVVPIMAGFGNFLVPLMIGARDMAFPRLNAASYWLFAVGGIVLWSSWFATGGTAKAGWWSYPTLSEAQFSPGHGQDYWILSIHILTLSSLFGAINFIATIVNMRARGMSWMRMPLFVWSMLTYGILLLVALPTVAAAVTMLLLDRQVGTHFFIPSKGGSVLLYQHMFWFFGHPEVYIMVLPAFGMISEILPVFSRKPIFGYKAVAFSTLGIAFFSMLVWAHHMFTVGLGNGLDSFFMISSMIIAVPTGVKIFNWLATTWRGNLIFDTPMLFAIGFLGLFTMGGLSGLFLAAFPVDWQLNDSYYVVAHFHYVAFGGIAFALFAGLHYWWPKMFGRMLDERLGKLSFWVMFVGFNVTFLPQHMLGLLGMPRRVYTYHHGGLWELYNMTSTVGSGILTLGVGIFVWNVWRTTVLRQGVRAGNDPWLADTLEWYTTSPPPPNNFDTVPYVTSARPLRDLRVRLAEESS